MHRFLLGTVLITLTLIGCAHDKDVKQDDTSMAAPMAAPAASTQASAPAPGCTGDQACGAKQLCLNSQCADITANMAECGVMRLHFAYNVADIKDEDKPNLDRMGRCLNAERQMTVTIEGNADERGSEDYNATLGEKRAFAVSNYLQTKGVSDTQLKTVSYGKDNPRCMEHDEACWAKNRRTAIKPKDTGSRPSPAASSKRGRKGAEAPHDNGQSSIGSSGLTSPNNQ